MLPSARSTTGSERTACAVAVKQRYFGDTGAWALGEFNKDGDISTAYRRELRTSSDTGMQTHERQSSAM